MLSLGCTGFYFSSMATTKPHRTPSWWKFRDAFGPTWFLALGAAHELATHQKIPRGSVMVEPKDIRFHSGEVTAGRHDEVGPFPSFAFQDYISVRVDSDEVRLKVESQKQQGVDCGNMYIPVCLVKYEALPLQSGNNLMSWEVLGEANGHIPVRFWVYSHEYESILRACCSLNILRRGFRNFGGAKCGMQSCFRTSLMSPNGWS
eukprot:TRINITY_DN157_c0_g2_i7.p2 TRINITY_DN157_c0_g2~~TRINITY_DN157_c0_g2_i7.p2  ORF type:complete len:204 (+),score=27.13 TRINITY_DN157_c0_g2_i7:591-1202(+)